MLDISISGGVYRVFHPEVRRFRMKAFNHFNCQVLLKSSTLLLVLGALVSI